MSMETVDDIIENLYLMSMDELLQLKNAIELEIIRKYIKSKIP